MTPDKNDSLQGCLCETYRSFSWAAVLGRHACKLLAERCLNASSVAGGGGGCVSRGALALCSSPSRAPVSVRTRPFVCGSVPDGASVSDFISSVLLPSQLPREPVDRTRAKGDFNQTEPLETRRPSRLSRGLLIIWWTLTSSCCFNYKKIRGSCWRPFLCA